DLMSQANQYALSKSGKLVWTTQFSNDWFQSQIKLGECFVLRKPDRPITAAITISEQDAYSWGDQGNDGQALYLHKLMKNPKLSQPNAGLKLIHFAAQEALRRDKQIVRCDFLVSMSRLLDYYERLGFIEQRLLIYKASDEQGVLLQANSQDVLEKTAQHG